MPQFEKELHDADFYTVLSLLEKEILASGAIGEICSASATFGCPLSHVERMARPELAGGALLDLGVYPFTFLSLFMESDIASIATEAVKTTLGVDAQSTTNALLGESW